MSRYKPTKVFVIREVGTSSTAGQLIKFGSKCGWISASAAKIAFNMHMKSHFGLSYMDDCKGLYDGQDDFKIEEVV